MLKILSVGLIVLLLAFPIVSSVRLVWRRKSQIGAWLIWAVFSSVGCYVLLISSVQLTEIHLENELNQFDLDGNGLFSGEEITPEMSEAMKAVTHDTGRTFAPITGLVTCPVYSGFWHVAVGLPFIFISRRNGRKNFREHLLG